ncbi:MAG: MscL family protein [bacterium]
MKGFIRFIREQGTIGLAVGFLLGGAVSKMVTSLVTDIINPILSPLLGAAGNFREATLSFGPVYILWGDFLANLIDFGVIAAIVYFGVHGFGLDKIDKPKIKK